MHTTSTLLLIGILAFCGGIITETMIDLYITEKIFDSLKELDSNETDGQNDHGEDPGRRDDQT